MEVCTLRIVCWKIHDRRVHNGQQNNASFSTDTTTLEHLYNCFSDAFISQSKIFLYTVCFNVFTFYDDIGDRWELILAPMPNLCTEMTNLTASRRACLHYVCTANMSSDECKDYYNHIRLLYNFNVTSGPYPLNTSFPTLSSFTGYFHNVKQIGVLVNCGHL